MIEGQEPQESAIDALLALIVESAWFGSLPNKQLAHDFAKVYFFRESAQNLSSHTPEQWLSIYQSHFEFFIAPYEGVYKVRVINLPGCEKDSTFVQVVAKDIPFLVDSLSMAVSRSRYGAHYLLNSAGFIVDRNEDGCVESVLPYSSKGATPSVTREAVVMIEVSYEESEEARLKMTEKLENVLNDVSLIVSDWQPMKTCLDKLINELNQVTFLPEKQEELTEVLAFLQWVYTDNFIFFGYREYELVGEGEGEGLRLLPDSGLGVFHGRKNSLTFKTYCNMPKKARLQAQSTDMLLTLGKTNTESTIHRDSYTDEIIVKRFDAQGNMTGQVCLIGLYTSAAYTQPAKQIPILRKKAEAILEKANLPPGGHLWKSMVYIINNLPRDDFMHADLSELYLWCLRINQVVDKHRTQALFYIDSHKRYISCLVYLPRENMSTRLAKNIKKLFEVELKALEVKYHSRLFAAATGRIHFQIRVDPATINELYRPEELQKKIDKLAESWIDCLGKELLGQNNQDQSKTIFKYYRDAFPRGYRDEFSALAAVLDVAACERVLSGSELAIRTCQKGERLRIKLFRENAPLPLSDVLPIFENMGIRVDSEYPYLIKPLNRAQIWLSDFDVILDADLAKEIENAEVFKAALYRSWSGSATNDAMNKLVLKSGLAWEKIRVLRAYAAFFNQIKFEISQEYIAKILVSRHTLAEKFIELFFTRFDPAFSGDREQAQATLESEILQEMESIQSLDEDRVCRQYLGTIQATIRTNFFKSRKDDPPACIAFKLDSSLVPGMVQPAPAVEAFVYSSSFEGTHLRMSKVARGGLRWSSRQEDYRTEVLGLARAQQVKNSVIVPRGAKGGFVLKKDLQGCSRNEAELEARRCYAIFMHGLLDLVDNVVDGTVVCDANQIRYDQEDTYLVVAADKGTATFSDLANSVSQSRDFWLGDAFASGGSNGYDHKKMGITAKGAWVSVTRHFKELGVDLSTASISVVGIGDMSGDVFGNGMLLSPNLQLKAAFNHIHIFIDPNPEPASSFQERQRLFDMPRSSWTDYRSELISEGGGVFDRSAKSIALTEQMQELLQTKETSMEPNELIRQLIMAPVDLLWNGGIGTYVKSSSQTNAEVGDPVNDRLRVNGADLSCKVIGEGGNLGLTQEGRVEFEIEADGMVCTDFIDNSAGVNCSDLEVNIKILLNACQASGSLVAKDRNSLLESMTSAVSELVLLNNERQTCALQFIHFFADKNFAYHAHLIQYLIDNAGLNPELENLPLPDVLRERGNQGRGLTLPELSGVFSQTKLYLRDRLVGADLVGDPDLVECLFEAFPAVLRDKFFDEMCSHNLANEIIATVLVNSLSSDVGVIFFRALEKELAVSAFDIVRAYDATMKIFGLRALINQVDAMSPQVLPAVRHQVRSELAELIRRSIRWILRTYKGDFVIADMVKRFKPVTKSVFASLNSLPIDKDLVLRKTATEFYQEAGLDPALIETLRELCGSFHGLSIGYGAHEYDLDVSRFSQAYFLIFAGLDLGLFREKIDLMHRDSVWSELARYSFKQELDVIQCQLAACVISSPGTGSVEEKFNLWMASSPKVILRWQSMLEELKKDRREVESAIIVMGVRILQQLVQGAAL